MRLIFMNYIGAIPHITQSEGHSMVELEFLQIASGQ